MEEVIHHFLTAQRVCIKPSLSPLGMVSVLFSLPMHRSSLLLSQSQLSPPNAQIPAFGVHRLQALGSMSNEVVTALSPSVM